MRNQQDHNYVFIVAAAVALIIWVVVLLAVGRQFNKEQYQASVRLSNAKAQFFESRAKNLEYQQSCTPASDALDLIADALDKPTPMRSEAVRPRRK